MRADGGVYPRLGRYFETTSELASAACMTRPTLLAVLKGQRNFTESEKAAIRGRLLAKVMNGEIDELTTQELLTSNSFDELFKSKELNLWK